MAIAIIEGTKPVSCRNGNLCHPLCVRVGLQPHHNVMPVFLDELVQQRMHSHTETTVSSLHIVLQHGTSTAGACPGCHMQQQSCW